MGPLDFDFDSQNPREWGILILKYPVPDTVELHLGLRSEMFFPNRHLVNPRVAIWETISAYLCYPRLNAVEIGFLIGTAPRHRTRRFDMRQLGVYRAAVWAVPEK